MTQRYRWGARRRGPGPSGLGGVLVQSPVRIFATLVVVALVVEATQEGLRTLLPDLPRLVEVAVGAVWLPVLLAVPLWRLVLSPLLVQHARDVEEMAAREHALQQEAARLDFDTQLRSALEMAEGEDDVIDVVSLALGRDDAGTRQQLMLATDPDEELHRVAVHESPAGLVDCDVRGVRGCPAVRRGSATVFEDSEDMAACPRLRGRNEVAVQATCVPVAVLGSPVGVVHAVAPRDGRGPDAVRLASLAQRVGTRLSMVRLLAEVTEQAATDPLTGLANRRRLAETYDRTLADVPGPHALAMCDLDHFKVLNDTHGHDVGDEALRLFAAVLREVTRPGDLAVRFGGEEFAVFLPGCSTERAAEVLDRVRGHLVEELDGRIGVPAFTVSIGVADTEGSPRDLAGLLHAADEALYTAKQGGRDRVVAAA